MSRQDTLPIATLARTSKTRARLLRLIVSLLLSLSFGLLMWWSLPVSVTLAQGTANLGLTKTFSGGSTALTVDSGQEFTYYLAYACSVSGIGDCENVVITDTLDSALEFRSVTGLPTGATVDLTNLPTVVINLGTVNDGDNRVLQLNVRFTPGTEPGLTAPNTATINASNGSPVSDGPIFATAQGQFEMTSNKTIGGDVDDGVIGSQFITNYQVRVCSPDEIGGVRLTNPTIVDALPPEATFISANPAATYISATHTVSWTHQAAGGNLPDVIEVGGCYIAEVRVSFPTGTVISGTVVTNQAQVTGAPEFAPPTTYDSGPLSHNLTLIDPFYDATFGKSSTSPSTFSEVGQTEELPGGVVTYTLSYANVGTVPILDAVVTDTIPASQTVHIISVDVVSDPVTLLYQSAETSGWQSYPGNTYSAPTSVPSTTLGLAPTDYVTALRWDLGVLPLGAPAWSGGFSVILDPTLPFSQTAQNCADVSASWDDQGTPTDESHTACNDVTTIDLRSIPRTYKAVSDNSVIPEDVVTFTIRAVNENVAHLPVKGPITLADVLPEELEVVVADAGDPSGYRAATPVDSWYTFTSTDGAPSPTATLTLNYSGTQQTFMSWAWPDAYQQNPAQELVIEFAARIKKGTYPSNLDNRSRLLWGATTVNPLPCSGDNLYTDGIDIDNDSDTTETGCRSSNVPTTVEVFLSMSSEKHVFGQLDAGWNKDGLTIPGGDVDYKLTLTNTSNVTVTDLVVYDILPFVGDVGVIDSQPRDSIWRPNLQAPVSGPPGVPLTVYYSRSQNPCRPEVLSANPGCTDDWSTSLPADMTSVQALKFEFCDGGDCLALGPDTGTGNGGAVTLTWEMVAPNDAPYEPDRAWNSFGFTAFQQGGAQLKLPPAEPNKVGIRLQAPDPNLINLGNFVWFDVYGQQNDGIQQPEELGVNGVRVEIYDAGADGIAGNGDDAIVDIDGDGETDYRVTGPNAGGQAGYYLFNQLPPNTYYYLRFFPPLTYTVNNIDYSLPYTTSIGDAGGDDSLDSDGLTFGSSITYGTYIESGVISTTTALTTDLTWDQGIWLTTDYGDAPGPYPTAAISQTNPATAARHVIVPGLHLGSTVDDELDGQPHSQAWGDDLSGDDEDGVQFEHYLGTAAQPSGVMILGETASLTVTTAVPVSQTGYLNAWLDFNGDGDWDDAGEQIATNQPTTGGPIGLNSITVPASVTTYTTYARFRFSTEQNLTPYGAAPDGEVEDYQVQFISQPQKALTTTSESHTAGANVTIGEIARYRLTIPVPQGTMSNFTITDTLPAGLQFLDDGTTTVVYSATTSLTGDSLVISGGPFGSGTDPVFSLGTVVNSDDDQDEEYVNLEFNALVTNTSGNQQGLNLDNRFTVAYDTFLATSDPVTITVVEPAITNLAKTVLATPQDAGDVAGYQVTYSNAGPITAFDVVLTDTLDLTYLVLDTGSITVTPAGGAGGVSDASAGNTLTVTVDTVPVGGSVTVAYSATLTSAVIPGNLVTNTAQLIYTSLPLTGTSGNPTGSVPPGDSGDPDGERNGSGGVNDYSDTDPANVTINAPVPTKTLVSTSEGHTGFVSSRENLAIGEIARFRLVAELPEGTAPWLQFRDLVPNNLLFLNDGTAMVAFVANGGGITSTTLISGTLGCDGGANPNLHFSGNSAAGVTPECALPNSAAGSNSSNSSDQDTYISGTDVYFKLGTVTNHDDDADAEFVIVEFNALATDITGNQAGTTFDNRFDVRIDNDNDDTSELVVQSGTVPLRLAEPDLSLTKVLNTAPVDAGDTISYTITMQNIAAGSSAADAFDLLLTDTLDSYLTLTGWNISAPGGRTVTDTTSAPTLSVAVDQLAPGESVSVVVTATVSASAPAGQTIPNTAHLLYTSLPGPQGTTTNPTGSSTPGASGDTDGERDGSDGSSGSPDDYAKEADAPLLINGSAPTKQLVGTSAAHTSGTDVTIGEIITYSIAVDVPEGIVSSLAVTDTLPAGLAYNGVITFDTSTFNGTFSPGDPTVSSGGGSGDDVLIDYSSPITVPADNIGSNNSFTITLQAVVTDVVGNVGLPPQTDLPNTATIRVGGGIPITSPPITTTVVEPQLVITKNIVQAGVAAGDFITISLTVRNQGLSDAFEVIVEDPMPNDTFIAFNEATTPAGFTYSTVPAGADTIIRYTGGDIAVNESVIFTFTAQLTTPVTKDLVKTNVATVTQATTLPGSDPNERDEPDVSDSDTVTLIALSLGNQVWFDANNNGLLDGGETGLDGVVLNLLDGAGTPITDTFSGLPITTTTSGGGSYTFTDLVAGDYIVEIDPANFGSGQPLENYLSSSGATDPDGDIDDDDNGVDDSNPAANGIRSLPVTLTYNGETLGDEDGDSDLNSNMTVDFGLVLPDYGDAPNSYATTTASNGARHIISPTLYLGAAVDAETDGQPNVNADGDDTTQTGGVGVPADDEDGVQFSALVIGQTATLTITAVGNGALDAWLDFGDDGAWNEAVDHIFDSRALVSGTNILTFNVPLTTNLTAATYARFRFSSSGGLAPTGLAADGEIEDYLVALTAKDYGDLPDSYDTTAAAGGAAHTIFAGLYLGSRVDAEADGQPSPNADGDDSGASGPALPTVGDDEDGITFDTPLIPGEVATITVQAVGNGNFSGWIDFDGSGAFDPGERVFTNTAILSGTTVLTFIVPVGAAPGDTGVRFRYTSDTLAGHAGPASDGEVEDYLVSIVRLDYGDLPAVYPTLNGSDPARHVILTANNPTLGATVDEETDGAASANADGDDLATGDDEDGVVFGGDFFPGETTTITVTAAITGLLNAWIDFNGDGDFNDGGEQISTDQAINGGANLVLPVTVPLTATQGITAYSRFRFSSDAGLSPGGLASDGEVEDYATPLPPLDWGDLPDSTIPATPNYPTRDADDGARHAIILGNNPMLGSRVDAEGDGQPAAAADADDSNNGPINEGGAGDDEDGVALPVLVPGAIITVTVTYSNPTGSNAYLNGWLDVDGDGTLEQIATDTLLPPGSGSVDIPVNVPLSASQGTVYSRFRISSQGGLGLTGFAPDGEVEDHPTMLGELDYGDLPHDGAGPQPDYPTQQADDGARHIILTANNPTLGSSVDSEADGQPTIGADGDDSNGDDEDGVQFSGALIPGETTVITVTASAAANGLLNGWIDFNGNGVLGDAGEQIAVDQVITAGATLPIAVNVPVAAAQGITTYARFRFSSDSGLAPTGLASDGEVEDYALTTVRLDYGDLPNDGPGSDPDFPVLYVDDGPRHVIDPTANPMLGATVDSESNGQPAVSANGDDLNGDDEDGVTFSGTFIPGQTITVTVSYTNPTGGNTYLNAWFDSDGDDVLEQIATDQVVPPGAGTVPISVPIPPTATPGDLYSRFRLSSDSGLALTGLAGDGEVEDHVITLQPALPAIAIDKTADTVRVAPNHGLLTYTIRITNTGNVPLNPVRLTDTLATGLSYATGTANPPASSVTGQQLVWNDLTGGAGLAPGSSLLVTLGANVTSTVGVYSNTVVVEGTHPVTSPTATDEEPVAVEDPTITLNKALAAPGVVGNTLTFTIQITNTGPSPLMVLPLFDTFTGPIEYVGGTPAADQVDNVNGQLAWTNLVDYFGLIAPNQVVTISTVFNVVANTTEFSATNQAYSTGGQDTNGNVTNDDNDQVNLNNIPTAVDLLYFRSSSLAGNTLLEWATAVEYDNFGFAILRSETGNLADAVEIAFVEGQGLGMVQGQTYSYTDSTVVEGQTYTYWLVDVDFDGERTVHQAQPTTVTITAGGSVRLYLPFIVK